jgi:hypothetical protein
MPSSDDHAPRPSIWQPSTPRMTELSRNAKLALESLETKPSLNTPALIAQNEGIERAEAEAGLAELKEAGLVRDSVMGWKLKPR